MVSPRLVMQYLAEHEDQFTQTQNTYWVQFELLWRDYFFYTARYALILLQLLRLIAHISRSLLQ